MADRAFSRSQTMSTNWADDVEEDEELERGKPLSFFSLRCCACGRRVLPRHLLPRQPHTLHLTLWHCSACLLCKALPAAIAGAACWARAALLLLPPAALAPIMPPAAPPSARCSGVAAAPGLPSWPRPWIPSVPQPAGCAAATSARGAAHATSRRRWRRLRAVPSRPAAARPPALQGAPQPVGQLRCQHSTPYSSPLQQLQALLQHGWELGLQGLASAVSLPAPLDTQPPVPVAAATGVPGQSLSCSAVLIFTVTIFAGCCCRRRSWATSRTTWMRRWWPTSSGA